MNVDDDRLESLLRENNNLQAYIEMLEFSLGQRSIDLIKEAYIVSTVLIGRHEQISSVLPGFVYIMDVQSRQLVWSCGALNALTGYTIDEINALPDGWIGMVHPNADTDVKGFPVMNHRGKCSLEYRIRTRFGEKWIRDTFTVGDGVLNGAAGMVGFVQDITCSKRDSFKI